MISKALKTTLLSTAIAAFIVGCGGSSDNSTRQGVAIDFALDGADVFFKDCDYSVTTNALGKFDLPDPKNCLASEIIITGGVDTATGQDFDGVLKFKKTEFYTLSDVVVSPLTSLEFYLDKAGKADQLNDVLAKLGITLDSDVKTYNPEEKSNEIASKVFILQQLITIIEPKVNGNTETAVNAVIDELLTSTTNNLFQVDSIKLESSVVSGILAKAGITGNEATFINSQVSELSKIVDDAQVPNQSIADLKTELTKQKDEIEAISTAAVAGRYTNAGFEFAGSDLSTILASSSSSPLSLPLSNLSSNLNVKFKLVLEDAKNTTDTLRLGLKLVGTRNSATKNLDLIINKVRVGYDSTGAITSATIPANTQIAVSTTFSGQPTNTIVSNTNDINIYNNGAISLAAVVQSSPTLANQYNNYISQIAANDALEASAYVNSLAYDIDVSSLAEDTLNIASLSLTGKKITGFFKIN